MKKQFLLGGIVFLFSLLMPTHLFAQDIQHHDVLVGTIERPPFSFKDTSENIKGFSIELWKNIAHKLKIPYTFQIYTGFSDMLDAVATGDIDLAMANISITSQREEKMDFSLPIYNGGLRILVKKKNNTNSNQNTITNMKHIILDNDLLRVLSVVLFTIIILLLAFTLYPKYRKKHFLMVSFYLIGLGILAFIIIQTKNIAYHEYTPSRISSYKDLIGKKVGAGKNTTMSKFLDHKGIHYTAYSDYKNSLIALEKGEINALVADAPVAEYYAHHDGKEKVQLVGKLFAPDEIAFALKQNSPLLEQINTILLEMKESGEYQKIRKKWFGK